jgi:D-alanine-D-alanine ligase
MSTHTTGDTHPTGSKDATGTPIRVAVIGGGQNCEHEVSLATAASVRAALDPDRYETVALTIGEDGRWFDGAGQALGETAAAGLSAALSVVASCDVVFPAVHGPRGEDGTLAGLCELAGVPYVGAGVRGGALAMDKWATKLIAEARGIGVAAGVLVTAATAGELRYERPVVVKPVAAGSSHGVSLVRGPEELAPALKTALDLDDRVLVEELLTGREIDIAVLERPDGSRFTGPPLEIGVPDGALFDTTRKYDGSADFTIPAALDGPVLARMEADARALFDALGCAGVARFDFFVVDGAAGEPASLVLNEVNTMPGMTEQSQVPKMFAAAGLPYPRLLDELIRSALARAGRR